jgi:hypothetical protein
MKLGMYNENGVLEQYVHASEEGDLEGFELPPGYTLRDAQGAVVEFDDPADIIISAIRADLDSLNELVNQLEELKHG